MATTEAPATPVEPADPEAGQGSLASKLARIMGRLDRIERDGRVEGGQGYSYASADALSDILRPALAAEGVILIPADTQVIDQRIDEQEKVGRDGKPYTQTRYTCALRVEWVLTDSIETLRMATVGTGVDYSGKAANAAHTFARVNALKSAFHLSTGEDPEGHQGGGSSGGSRGGWQAPQGTGELPDVDPGAEVTGYLIASPDGRVGISFKAQGATFESIKNSVKDIPGREWNGEKKLWVVPAERAGLAVAIARHIGLTIPDDLAAKFPVEPADDLAPAAAPATAGPPADDDSIPF